MLNLLPKTKNKYLYRGKIWVDAKDFAVVRIEGEPARNPSFWIKKTEVRHSYVKVNDFWLPAENHTESVIRLGGKAILSIEYKDYKITSAAPLRGSENAREKSLLKVSGLLASFGGQPRRLSPHGFPTWVPLLLQRHGNV